MAVLQGKVAVITGGSKGIGLSTAKLFVSEGAYVFIIGRQQAELDKAVAEIGENVAAIQGDAANLEDLDRIFKTISGQKSQIDILFANAAFVEMTAITSVSPEHFDKTFDTNARGVFFAVQKAAPLMKDGGSIIITGNTGKEKGAPTRAAYNASKAALRSFVRAWAVELKNRQIRVNMLSPGGVETTILDSQFSSKEELDKVKAQFASMTLFGRLGRPEEIASAALFLASDANGYITGIDLQVDGGVSAI